MSWLYMFCMFLYVLNLGVQVASPHPNWTAMLAWFCALMMGFSAYNENRKNNRS